jgi:hypothetical protein
MSIGTLQPNVCDVERRSDGSILVRVHSSDRSGRRLPDAVFTFRSGDPQFGHWEQQARACAGAER